MQSGSSPAAKSGTPGRKAQLEAMSHEDLVQNCLKQTVLLQKLKSRYDEVQKSATAAKENETSLKELQAKLNSGMEEKEQLAEDLKLSQKNLLSTEDELECTKMKLDTLMSSVQCLQEERDEILMKNKDATQNFSKISEKLAVASSEKQETEDRLRDSEQQRLGLKNHIKATTEKMQALENSAKDNEKLKNEIAALNITISTLKQGKASGDDSGPDTSKMKAVIIELKKRLKAQQEANEVLKKAAMDKEARQKVLENEVDSLRLASEEYQSFKASLEEKLNVGVHNVCKIIEQMRTELEESSSVAKMREENFLAVKREKNELAVTLDALVLEKSQLTDKIRTLSETSSKQKEHCEKENQELKSQFQILEKQLKDVSDGKNDNENLQIQIKLLQEENSKVVQDLESAKKQVGDSCRDLESAQRKLKENTDVLEEEKLGLNQLLQDVEKKLRDSQERESNIRKELEEGIQSLKNANSDLVDQNESLEVKAKELLDKDAVLKELREDLQKLDHRNKELEDEIEQREVKLSQDEENLGKRETDLQIQLDQKEAEIFHLQERMNLVDKGMEQHDLLQEQMQKLASDNEFLAEEKGQLDSLVKEYSIKIKDLQSLVMKYEKEFCLLQDKAEENNLALKESDLKSNDLEKEIKNLQEEMTKKDDVSENLQREVDELKSRCVNLDEALLQLTDSNKTLSAELEDAQQNLEKVNGKLDEQTKADDSLKDEFRILNYSSVERQQGLMETKEDEACQQQVLEENENDSKTLNLQTQLKDLTMTCENLAKELEVSNRENTAMNEKIVTMQSQMDDLRKKCDDLETFKQEKEESFLHLEQEMASSTSKLEESYQNELKRMQEENDSETKIVKEKMESLRTEKKNCELQLSCLESDCRDLKLATESVNEANKKLEAEIVAYQSRVEMLEAERRKVELENDSSRSELGQIQKSLEISQEKVIKLQNDNEKALESLKAAEKKLEDEREAFGKNSEDLKRIIAARDLCLDEGTAQSACRIEDSQRKLTETQNEKDRLLKEMEIVKKDHEAEITLLEKRESEIREQVEQTLKNFEDLQLKFSHLSMELETEKAKNSDLEDSKESLTETQEMCSKLKEENRVVLQDLEGIQLKNCNLEKEVKSLHSAKEKEESALANTREELKVVNDKLEEKAAELSSSREVCTQLEERVEQLTVELKQATTKIEVDSTQRSVDNSEEKKIFEKALKEKEEYCNKLKMIAVKAKKEFELAKKKLKATEDESAALTTKVQTLSAQLQGSQTQASNVQIMQIECDKLQDQLDQAESEKKVIEKNLEDVVMQLKDAQAEKNDLESSVGQWKAKHDQVTMEKNDVSKLLTMTKATMEMLESERNRQSNEIETMKRGEETLKERISSLEEQLTKEKSSLEDTKQYLTEAKKGMKHHDMLALEMAQYERTVSELQETVQRLEESLKAEKENSEALTERLSKLHEDRNAAEQFRREAEDRANQANQQFVSCKEEITDLQAEVEELRNRLAEATVQIQDTQHKTEHFKLELSNSSSEVSRLQQKIASTELAHGRSTDMMQRKINSLQTDLDYLRNEKDNLEMEYEGYKVRVHTVLKQQKSKGQEQEKKSEEEQKILLLTSTNDQLKTKLAEVRHQIQLHENELQLVNADYERLIKQHEQDKERAAEREGRWKGRVQDLQLELSTLQRQYAEATTQTNRRNDSMSSNHKREMESLNQQHGKELENVRKKLADMENELFRFQAEKASLSQAETTNKVTSTPKRNTELSSPVPNSSARVSSADYMQHHRHHSHHQPLDYRSMAREDAEGQENPEVPQTFERLLSTSTDIKAVSVISDLTATSEAWERNLEAKYEAQSKKLDHLSEVVRENEATVSRLTEQNRVLKEEIRRLEKNQERETSVANMEYLKNVLYKFITLPPGDEKRHLLPVMDTMLKFDPKERAILQEMAADDAGAEGQKGWSGYFQRWSGLQ